MPDRGDDVPARTDVLRSLCLRTAPDEWFLDCGAADGDTLREFARNRRLPQFCAVCAVEPNCKNNDRLARSIALRFTSGGSALQNRIENAALVGDALTESVSFIEDGVSSRVGIDRHGQTVPATTIDRLCEYWHPTLIKLDIEGSEAGALKGGITTIKRDRPVLAVCLYHHPSDLWEIPTYLKAHLDGYNFYAAL